MSATLQLISAATSPWHIQPGCVLPLPPKPHPFVSAFALNVFVQEGKFYAHSATFGITSLIPKSFLNQSFESEEAAKELTIQAAKKTKAEEKANELAKKSTKVSNTKQKTHQKPAKDKKNTTASAPAKEDAPVTTPQ